MLQSRMQREIHLLATDPPPGVFAAPKDGHKLTELEAQIQGPANSVYDGGVFKLSVDIPLRYPIEPPKVRFITPIYHPNIDPEGRICLDILNPPPKGAWKPSLNVLSVLTSIGVLLADPNPDDGLVAETSKEYIHQRSVFDMKARQWTKKHAMDDCQNLDTADTQQPATNEQQQPQQQQQQPPATDTVNNTDNNNDSNSNKRVLSPSKQNTVTVDTEIVAANKPAVQGNEAAATEAVEERQVNKKSKLRLG